MIGIVEVLWKAVSGVANFWIGAVVDLHDMLHGFKAGRGTGTASLEARIIHQITEMGEEVLYKFFLDIIKSYDSLEWE